MCYTETMETTNTARFLVSEELDVSYGGEHDGEGIGDSLTFLLSHDDIHPECVRIVGPGGGWPVYRFHGTRANLIELYKRYYLFDDNAGNRVDFDAAVERLDRAELSIL